MYYKKFKTGPRNQPPSIRCLTKTSADEAKNKNHVWCVGCQVLFNHCLEIQDVYTIEMEQQPQNRVTVLRHKNR